MNEENRQALRAARPSGQDEQDPAVAQARLAASQEPGAPESWEKERLADLAFARALQSAEPPPELERRLLESIRALPTSAVPPEGMEKELLRAVRAATPPITAVARPTRRRRWIVTAAASAAALAMSGWIWQRRRPRRLPLAGLVEELAQISTDGVTLSLMTMDRAEIRTWMQDRGAPRADPLPPALDALGRKGCHVYQIAGHPVSLECFMVEGGGIIHLFCTEKRRLLDPPPAEADPNIETAHGHTVAVWTRGQKTVLLLSHEPEETVRALVT